MQTYCFMSGLPRTGSTLLSAILHQNPDIHTEGNSAVCQIMWDLQESCRNAAFEQLSATGRSDTADALVASVPSVYYRNVNASHIVDKCRSWTLPENMDMIRRHISPDPRVVVLTRPIDEVVASFVRLRQRNGWTGDLEAGLLDEGSEPIMRSLAGVESAKESGSGEFLFIEYADLVDSTRDVLDAIYRFCGWNPFLHDLDNVKDPHFENDHVYGLAGMHDVRPTISRST